MDSPRPSRQSTKEAVRRTLFGDATNANSTSEADVAFMDSTNGACGWSNQDCSSPSGGRLIIDEQNEASNNEVVLDDYETMEEEEQRVAKSPSPVVTDENIREAREFLEVIQIT